MKLAGLLILCLALVARAEAPPVAIRDPQAPAVRELVDLAKLDAGLRFDLRYATPDNFTKTTLYPVAKAYLHHTAAEAVVQAQRELAKEGLGLKVFDAYRPLAVQWTMWKLIHDDRYVSDPRINAGRHTRGTAIDLTLVDREGRELLMPTPFDDFTERAHRDAKGIAPEAARNAKKLEKVMQKYGFIPYPFEWWHFDFRDWKKHPPLDVPLEQLP